MPQPTPTRLLALVLSLELSGAPALFAAPHGTPPRAEAAPRENSAADALATTGARIDQALARALSAARRAKLESRRSSYVSSSDLERLETELRGFAAEISDAVGRGTLSTELKLGAVNRYLNLLTSLTTLRITLGQTHDARWRETLTLTLSPAAVTDLPVLGQPIKSAPGAGVYPMTVSRSGDRVEIRLSEALVTGLEAAALGEGDRETQHLTLIQYLAVQQITQNLASVRELLGTADRAPPPAIAPELARKLPSLGLHADAQREQRRQAAEPELRAALAATAATVAAQVPAFANPAFAARLARMINEAQGARGDTARRLADRLADALMEREREGFVDALAEELIAGTQPLAAAPKADRVESLRLALSNARANTLLEVLIQLSDEGALTLDEGARQRILDTVETARASYALAVAPPAIETWLAAAERERTVSRVERRRREVTASLVKAAQELTGRRSARAETLEIEPRLLARMVAPELARREMRASVQEWLLEISNEASFAAARDRYAQILTQLTSPNILAAGVVSPTLVRQRVAELAPQRESRIDFGPGVDPRLGERMNRAVTDGRRKDILDLLSLGEKMGFHRAGIKRLTLAAVLTDDDDRGDYLGALEASLRSEYPVLSLELGAPLERPITRRPLAELLAAVAGGDRADDPSVTFRSWPYVQAALTRMEGEILANLARVGRARTPAELESVITGAMMMELVLQGYPEFRVQQERLVEDLLTPSLTTQLMRKYAGWYLGPGFLGVMLLHLSRPVTKRVLPGAYAGVRYLNFVLRPVVAGYLRTAALVVGADLAHEYRHLKHAKDRRERATSWFFSGSADGAPLVDFLEYQSALSAYRMSQGMFLFRVVFDGFYVHAEVTRPLLRKAVARLGFARAMEVAGDARAFRKLGLAPGQWDRLPESGRRLRELRLTGDAGAVARAEAAYTRLMSRYLTGGAWSAEGTLRGGAPTPAYLRLKQTLTERQGDAP